MQTNNFFEWMKKSPLAWVIGLLGLLLIAFQFGGGVAAIPPDDPTATPPAVITATPSMDQPTAVPQATATPVIDPTTTIIPAPTDQNVIRNGEMNPPYIAYGFYDFDNTGDRELIMTVEVAHEWQASFNAPPSTPDKVPAWEDESGIVYLAVPEYKMDDCSIPSPHRECAANNPPAQKIHANGYPYIARIQQENVPTCRDCICTLSAFVFTRISNDGNQGNLTTTLRDREASKWTLGVMYDGNNLTFQPERLEPEEPFDFYYLDDYGHGHYEYLTEIKFSFLAPGTPVTAFVENQRLSGVWHNDSVIDDVTFICRRQGSDIPTPTPIVNLLLNFLLAK